MDWPFGVVKFVRPQTPPIVELLVIYDLKTTSQSVLLLLDKHFVRTIDNGVKIFLCELSELKILL